MVFDTSSTNEGTRTPTGSVRSSGRVAEPASQPRTNNLPHLFLTTLTLFTMLKQPSRLPNRILKERLQMEINRCQTRVAVGQMSCCSHIHRASFKLMILNSGIGGKSVLIQAKKPTMSR